MSRRLLTLLSRRLYSNKVRRLSPIAYWPLDEKSGTTAFDRSGNGRNGAYTGVDLGQPGIGDGRTSAYFDGTNDYIGVLTAISAVFNGAEGTALIWVRASGSFWTDGLLHRFVTLFVDTNNRIALAKETTNNLNLVYVAGGTVETINTAALAGRTTWFPVLARWSKSGDAFRVDTDTGQLGTTQTGLGTFAGTLTVGLLGAQNTTPAGVMLGNMAHAALWGRYLSDGEAASLLRVN